jgi:hypothetical protein
MDKMDDTLQKVFGPDDRFPAWGKAEEGTFEEKPKLPRMSSGRCVMDYLRFLMEFCPSVQKMGNLFYHQICAVSNTVFDKEEKERDFDELEGGLKELRSVKEELVVIKNQTSVDCEVENVKEAVEELRRMVTSMKQPDFSSSLERIRCDLDILRTEVSRGFVRSITPVKPEKEPVEEDGELDGEKSWSSGRACAVLRGTHSGEKVRFSGRSSYDDEEPEKLEREDVVERPVSSQSDVRSGDGKGRIIAAVAPRGSASSRLVYSELPGEEGAARAASGRDRRPYEIEERETRKVVRHAQIEITGNERGNFMRKGRKG